MKIENNLAVLPSHDNNYTKHINIKFRYVCDQEDQGTISSGYAKTDCRYNDKAAWYQEVLIFSRNDQSIYIKDL